MEQKFKKTINFVQTSETDTSDWKQAYIDYLNTFSDEEYYSYGLFQMDSDGIPELAVSTGVEATGVKICNYDGNSVRETQLRRLGFFYIENANLLCNGGGHMDVYFDIVYSIQNGVMTRISEGLWGAEDNANVQIDENGDPIYVYNWNGQQMSKEEYDANLKQVFDYELAEDGYFTAIYTKQEILEQIKNF